MKQTIKLAALLVAAIIFAAACSKSGGGELPPVINPPIDTTKKDTVKTDTTKNDTTKTDTTITPPVTYKTVIRSWRVSSGGMFFHTGRQEILDVEISNASTGGIHTMEGGNVYVHMVNCEKATITNSGYTLSMTFPQNFDGDPNNDVDPYAEIIDTNKTTKVITVYQTHLYKESWAKKDGFHVGTVGKYYTDNTITYDAAYMIKQMVARKHKIVWINIVD